MNEYQITYMDKSTEVIDAYSYSKKGKTCIFDKGRVKVERHNVWFVTLLETAVV